MDLTRFLIKDGEKINPNIRKMLTPEEKEQFSIFAKQTLGKDVCVLSSHILDIAEVFYALKTPDVRGICATCSLPTKFLGLKVGYAKFCNASCQMRNSLQQHIRTIDAQARFGVNSYLNIGKQKNAEIHKTPEFRAKQSAKIRQVWSNNKQQIIEKMQNTRAKNGKLWWLVRNSKQLQQLADQNFTIISSKESGRPLQLQHSCGMLQEYGRCAPNNRYLCVACMPNPRTQAECSFLDDLENHFNVKLERQTKIGKIKVDALFGNIALDFNGLFWHSQAAEDAGFGKYNPTYHRMRYDECQNNNIKLIQVFEDDWQYRKQIVLERLAAALGKASKRAARKCKLVSVENKQAKEFIISKHISGNVPFSKAWALTVDDKIVAVATFGKTRFGKRNKIELLRFCSDGIVIGALSRLVKAASSFYKQDIISYSDCFWGNGSAYEKAGFLLERRIEAGYFYFDKKNFSRISRHAMRKDGFEKVFGLEWDSALNEIENAKRVHCFRVGDAGKLKWCFPFKH